jgi:hypothetical protein
MVAGRKPGIIVYIKAGSGRLYREFTRFCGRNGIDATPVQEAVDGRPEAWECVGAVADLERLTGHEAVARWHYILNVKPPIVAGGSGDVTGRAEKALRLARLSRAEREAVEETERRARLPQAERDAIEIAELKVLPKRQRTPVG